MVVIVVIKTLNKVGVKVTVDVDILREFIFYIFFKVFVRVEVFVLTFEDVDDFLYGRSDIQIDWV